MKLITAYSSRILFKWFYSFFRLPVSNTVEMNKVGLEAWNEGKLRI